MRTERETTAMDPRKSGYLHEDFRLFYNRDRGQLSVPLHYHDFHKIWILLSGNASYVIEGSRYDLRPMDIVLVRAGSMHRPLIHDDSLYERLILYLSDDFSITRDLFGDIPCFREFIRPDAGSLPAIRQVCETLVSLANAEVASSQATLSSLDSGSRSNDLQASSISKKTLMKSSFPQKPPRQPVTDPQSAPYGQPLYRRLKATELMLLLRRALESTPGDGLPSISTDDVTAAVMAYIREHLADPDLCVDSIAAHVSLHRSYLMHYFKKMTGHSIGRYITEKRLFCARSLLARGESATQACYESGFGTYSSFYRAYRERYGVSPAKKIAESIPYMGDV